MAAASSKLAPPSMGAEVTAPGAGPPEPGWAKAGTAPASSSTMLPTSSRVDTKR